MEVKILHSAILKIILAILNGVRAEVWILASLRIFSLVHYIVSLHLKNDYGYSKVS
jgi:hypothetical protein